MDAPHHYTSAPAIQGFPQINLKQPYGVEPRRTLSPSQPTIPWEGVAVGWGGRGCLGATPGTSPRGAGHNKTTKRNYNPPSTAETLVSMTRKNQKN